MRHHREVELKWALRADQYAELCSRLDHELGPARLLRQDNRFFDSPDHCLRQHGLNIRLRHENGRLLLTCKRRLAAADAHGLHQHDEWEEWLDAGLWSRLDDPQVELAHVLPLPAPIIASLGEAPLQAQGGFSNLRREHDDHHPGASALLCLDRTVYPGNRIDHELEIETAQPQEAGDRWRATLTAWGMTPVAQPLTKFARFLSASSAQAP
jgi:uncharacterized protein YjbK